VGHDRRCRSFPKLPAEQSGDASSLFRELGCAGMLWEASTTSRRDSHQLRAKTSRTTSTVPRCHREKSDIVIIVVSTLIRLMVCHAWLSDANCHSAAASCLDRNKNSCSRNFHGSASGRIPTGSAALDGSRVSCNKSQHLHHVVQPNHDRRQQLPAPPPLRTRSTSLIQRLFSAGLGLDYSRSVRKGTEYVRAEVPITTPKL
jgi:hypothetical protein